MPNPFRVAFGSASHGWLSIFLEYETQYLEFTASYLPVDSLANLIDALMSILVYETPCIVHWNTEPTEYQFIFTPQNGLVEFTVFQCSTNTTHQSPRLFTMMTTTTDIVTPFWRALKKLTTQETFEQEWGHPFPISQLDHLQNMLNN
jgi:hypothetical protein